METIVVALRYAIELLDHRRHLRIGLIRNGFWIGPPIVEVKVVFLGMTVSTKIDFQWHVRAPASVPDRTAN